jgi:hypothetical protein
MPDNWGFVAAAYGLTAAVLGLYWLRLVRRERALDGTTTPAPAARRRQPPGTGHAPGASASRRSLP